MLNIQTAALRLRRELTAAEKASDEFLLHMAAIQSTIIAARIEIDVPMNTGQDALVRLQRAMAQAIAAQSDLFRVHETLASVGREVMGPDEPYCPKELLRLDPNETVADLAA